MNAAQIHALNRPVPGTSLTVGKVNAIIATAYNLHIQKGEALTSAKAAELPRGDRAALCKILNEKGGSDLYTKEQAGEAYLAIVERRV